MIVTVKFDFKDITDPDSEEATHLLDSLMIDFESIADEVGADSWYIDDAHQHSNQIIGKENNEEKKDK